ncbi:MAG TPA: polyprenyl synthetase family protein [Micromonosporaceae bacterium]
MTVAADRMAQVRTMVSDRIRELLDRLDPRTRLVCGYHLGFWDADGTPASAGGKGLRPALALLSARAAGAAPERGLPAAVAVELVHNFSLLHDDVMDHDTERRHRATAWAVFGAGPAILAGDALLSLANEALTDAPEPTAPDAVRHLNVEVRRLIAGQSADLAFEDRDEVGIDECLTMVEHKTAALISCACSLGAELCGAPPALTAGLAGYGRHLGLAFQLVDDLLGIWGSPEVTGKPALSDLRARKKSVPVVWAERSGTTPGHAFADLYRLRRELTPAEVEMAALLIEAAGAREWTATRARREVAAARAELDVLDLPGDVRAELDALAAFVVERDY